MLRWLQEPHHGARRDQHRFRAQTSLPDPASPSQHSSHPPVSTPWPDLFKRGTSRQSPTRPSVCTLLPYILTIPVRRLQLAPSRSWARASGRSALHLHLFLIFLHSLLSIDHSSSLCPLFSNLFSSCFIHACPPAGTCFTLPRGASAPVTTPKRLYPPFSPLMACFMWSLPSITMLCTLHLGYLSVLVEGHHRPHPFDMFRLHPRLVHPAP